MKTLILLTLLAYLQMNNAFMTMREFKRSNFLRCYDTNMQDNRRPNKPNIHGQFLPLPSSTETFVSLVERYESLNPNDPPKELIRKLLKSFSMDDLHPIVANFDLRDLMALKFHDIRRAIFSVKESFKYEFRDDDFTDDEKCALHFMLSHTVNDTQDIPNMRDTNQARKISENGVVSLYSNSMHAFALGRVLLGIYAGFQFTESQDVQSIFPDKRDDENLQDMKSNLVYGVTIGDLVARLITENKMKILGNGDWGDTSCPTEYNIPPEDNEGGFVSYSELRGGVDGLIIGKKIQENLQYYSSFRLSQILRQYYGPTGTFDTSKPKWCSRESIFSTLDIGNEMLNFYKIGIAVSGVGSVTDDTPRKINDVISQIRENIFRNIDTSECSASQTSLERRFVSPRNIFAILDYTSTAVSTKLDFQAEVIGNLSSNFDLRPHGNLIGVYSNIKPLQQNTLDVVVKNNGTAGCAACFAKYYFRSGNKDDDAEIFRDLNDTLTSFDQDQKALEEKYQSETKSGSPGKIVLYFNFGNPSIEHRIQEALWDLRYYFRGVTILAIGNNRDNLAQFVENDQTDIFTSSSKTIYDLKQRINQVPAEYTYKECSQSNPSKEASNKQVAFIPINKVQYWAMYPQYFLKSFWITMKFTVQNGAGIRVCFSRWYGSILEGKNENCKDSANGEIEFFVKDPCYRKNVYNCDPFYFSVEGKKLPMSNCQSLRCSTPQDIEFEFEHQGISCNVSSYVSISSLALLFAAVMYYMQKQ